MLKGFLKKIWDGGDDPVDSDLYAVVAVELSEGSMDIGVWTKACALSGGVNDQAKASYIQMRVAQLRELRGEIHSAVVKEQRALEDESRQLRRKQAEQEERRRQTLAHNASIQAMIDELDRQRRPLLHDLYNAASDRKRRRAAEQLFTLDSRRAELVHSLWPDAP